MSILRNIRAALPVLALFVLPSTGFAQASASIVGTVRDSSGGVLPGVTVEASSPALIEKIRTTVTDSAGQYRIEQLRGGVYSITFSLSGFQTVIHQRRADRERRLSRRHAVGLAHSNVDRAASAGEVQPPARFLRTSG